MNTQKGRSIFKKFKILWDSGCSSTIETKSIIEKLNTKEYAVMQQNTKAGNITTNLSIKIYFTLSKLSATETVTWNCNVDDSAKGRYGIILGRDLLT